MRLAIAAFFVCFLAAGGMTRAQDTVNIDEAFLNTTITAAELSEISKGSIPKGYDLVQAFSDGSHRALVTKKHGTCFAAFSSDFPGTIETVWERIGSLFRLDLNNFEEACSNADKCCDLRSPVHRSYRHTSFRSAMETALRDCVAKCPNCPVVLTGHSQGGAGK
jgi:Lipase (class 3)